MNVSHLFSPLTLRGLTFKNRIAVSPMCQYSSVAGLANHWHLVHLGSRAVGGAALVLAEASAVLPEGRVSPFDLGLWSDEQIEPLRSIVEFVAAQGSLLGIQLAHAGRKASTKRPWEGQGAIMPEAGGWQPLAPSPLPFSEESCIPLELNAQQIAAIITAFAQAAQRAYQAGIKVIELHAAHGYLFHQFLSPLSNQRQDEYGGSFDNRIRLLLAVVKAVRQVWPEQLPLLVRVSATDWVEGGWSIDDTIALSQRLQVEGVDLIDTSSGGSVPTAQIPIGAGYQTVFAERIRHEAGIATAAVGFITSPAQADHIIRTLQADMVFLGREMLRNPYWPLDAAKELRHPVTWPAQYARAAS